MCVCVFDAPLNVYRAAVVEMAMCYLTRVALLLDPGHGSQSGSSKSAFPKYFCSTPLFPSPAESQRHTGQQTPAAGKDISTEAITPPYVGWLAVCSCTQTLCHSLSLFLSIRACYTIRWTRTDHRISQRGQARSQSQQQRLRPRRWRRQPAMCSSNAEGVNGVNGKFGKILVAGNMRENDP